MKATRLLILCFLFLFGATSPALAQPYCSAPVPAPSAPNASSPPPRCAQCGGEGSCKRSPCYAGAGIYSASATDLHVSTGALPLELARAYFSSRVLDGPLGVGWSSSLTTQIYVGTFLYAAPATYKDLAIVTLADGNRRTFEKAGDGTWTPPSDSRDHLVTLGDGSLELTPAWGNRTYRFSATGRLESIRDDLGHQQTYLYDANGDLQRVTDETTGRYIDIYWGPDGRLAAVEDSSGRQVQFTYDVDGTLRTASDPLDRVTRYAYSAGRFVPLLSRIADHWDRTITSITYDARDRTTSYSEAGETYSYSYDSATQTTKRDSAGNAQVFTLSSTGWLVTAAKQPTSVGGASETSTYNTDGTPDTVRDAMNVATKYTYTSSGKVATVTQAYGTGSAIRYDYIYDASFPDKVASVTPKNPSTNATLTNRQAWRYDYWPVGGPAAGNLRTVSRVRSNGAVEAIAGYEYDSEGRVTRQTSAGGAQTDYAFDAGGNLETVTGPANNDGGLRPLTRYGYDSGGRVTSVTDPLGHTTSYTYDALGRVLTVTLPKPSSSSALSFVTTYTYDNWDGASGLTFTHVTDPNGRTTRLGYDQYGRLVRSIDAANGTTVYGYGLLPDFLDR